MLTWTLFVIGCLACAGALYYSFKLLWDALSGRLSGIE